MSRTALPAGICPPFPFRMKRSLPSAGEHLVEIHGKGERKREGTLVGGWDNGVPALSVEPFLRSVVAYPCLW
jgi:hypothetical protein